MVENIVKKLKKSSSLNTLKNKFPLLTLYLVIRPLSMFRFKEERRILNGRNVATKEQKSVLFFTVHKCASTLFVKVLKQLADAKELVHVDLDSYFITTDNRQLEKYKDESFLKKVFHPKGFIYGVFRFFRTIPDIDKYQIVLVLRDPRDVLTSLYYSIGFSHTVLDKGLLNAREKAQNQTIDEFVLDAMIRFKKRYQDYCDELIGKPNVLFLKYEDMIVDFKPFLTDMVNHLDLNDKATVDNILEETSFKKKKEDKFSHIRSIKSGDHKDKLKPETIATLNREFKDILNTLEYPID